MTSSELSDPELLAAWLRRGSEAAFRDLVARYAGLVQATALRISGEASLAAEAAQLTFITLARRARSLTSCASLGGWLHQTAMLHVKSLQRSQQRELRKRQSLRTAMDLQPASHESAWRDLQPLLDEALAALPHNDREALLLRFYRALPVKQVAETLGIATDAAQKRIDRATERLRLRLAARGLVAGGTLTGVMLAGFAADVQAAAPYAAALSAQALSTAGAGFSFTALAAKAAPAAAVVAAGVWLTLQFRAVAALERENALLAEKLSVVPNGKAPAKTTAQVRTVLDTRPIDWQEVARQLRNRRLAGSNGFWFVDTAQRLRNGLMDMSREELIVSFDEVAAAGLSKADRALVEGQLLESMEDKDPGFVLDWHAARGFIYCALLEKWTLRSPQEAVVWYDRGVAAGRIKPHDTGALMAVVGSLLATEPAEAVRRFQTLPEELRNEALTSMDFGRAWKEHEWEEHDPVAGYAALARLLPEELRLPALDTPVTEIGEADRSEGIVELQRQLGLLALPGPGEVPLAALQDYLRRIAATAEERRFILAKVASIGLPPSQPPEQALQDLRRWVSTETPEVVDRVTGSALNALLWRNPGDYAKWADYALGLHEAGGDDALLHPFVHDDLTADQLEKAHVVAGSIRDPKQREEALHTLENRP